MRSSRLPVDVLETIPDLPRTRFARVLGAFVLAVANRPWLVIAAIGALTVAFAAGLPRIYFANERKLQLPADEPLIALDDAILERFGGGKLTVIGLEPADGDIFEPSFLRILRDVTREVEDLPYVDPSLVSSIADPNVSGFERTEDGTIHVDPIVPDDIPETAEELARVRDRVEGQPLLEGFLVSPDHHAAAVVADIDDLDPRPELRNEAVDAAVRAVVAPLATIAPDVRVYLGGLPILNTALDRYTRRALVLLAVAIVVIGLVHFEAFRTLQAMLLPLVTALLSVVWALGALGHVGLPMDAWNSLAPFLILAVAAGHAVQILKRYYEEYRVLADNRLAVVSATVKVGSVMITAGLIAASGFLTLTLFPIRTIQTFGCLSAFGILSALVIEMTFIPACRTLLPAPSLRELSEEHHAGVLERTLERLAALVTARPRAILAAALALLAVVAIGISRIEVENSFRDAFPLDDPVRTDVDALDARFGGTVTLNVLVTTATPDGLHEPAVLRAMRDLQRFLDSYAEIGRTLSVVDYVEEIHSVVADGEGDRHRLPRTRAGVAQALLVLEGEPDSLRGLIDDAHQTAVVRAFANDDRAGFIDEILSVTRAFVAHRFPPDVRVDVAGGVLAIGKAVNDLVIREKLGNTVVICSIIFGCSALVLRSAVGGLLVLVPTVLAALVNLGTMGLVGTWLNLATATITALTVSIGADYAIYYVFRYREELARSGSWTASTRATMLTSGKAVFFVATAISAGSLVLALSPLGYHRQLGAYVALSMAVSALGAVTLVPALIAVLRPAFLAGLVRAPAVPATPEEAFTAAPVSP